MLAVVIAGCATPAVKQSGPIFFPPAPNPPRIQYLKGIAESKDVENVKKSFSLFLTSAVEEEGDKFIAKPYGVTVFGGKIYVCDTLVNDVIIIDLVQQSFKTLKGNQGMGRLKKPINVTTDKKGNIFVADTARKEIVMYDATGNYLRSFGKEYDMKPVDVAVDADSIYALDLSHNEIKVIDQQSGQLVRSIGRGAEGTSGLSVPTNLAMDDNGMLYATNTGTGSVIKLDKDGHILLTFGKQGDAFGEFSRPRGISVDKEGRIYVVDAAHQNIQVFNEKGRLLVFFGDPGLPEGSMNMPAGVVVTRDNLDYFQKLAAPGFILQEIIIVTNQYGKDKVAFYGLGQMQEGVVAPAGELQKEKGEEQRGNKGKPASSDEKK